MDRKGLKTIVGGKEVNWDRNWSGRVSRRVSRSWEERNGDERFARKGTGVQRPGGEGSGLGTTAGKGFCGMERLVGDGVEGFVGEGEMLHGLRMSDTIICA